MSNPYDDIQITIPTRQPDAMSGSEFARTLLGVSPQRREELILAQYQAGNVPSFMRYPQEIQISVGSDQATIFVLPDYLCVGSDEDYFRTPMIPATGQQVADMFGCILTNRKMVNEIWKAGYKLAPQPLPPTSMMVSTEYYIQHNKLVNDTLKSRGVDVGTLVVGHQKDVVICAHIPKGKVVIYGWHQLNGVPIQGMNSTSHSDTYVDYSQCFRLVSRTFMLNGSSMDIEVFLRQDSGKLLSDEGPMQTTRYG